jgi:hypothetical protein
MQPNGVVFTAAGSLALRISGCNAAGSSALPATWTSIAAGFGASLVALKAV